MAKKTTDTIDAAAGAPAAENAVETTREMGPPLEPSEAVPVGSGEARERAETSQEAGAELNGLCDGAAEVNKSGFYIYIGPNLKGFIQTGTIFRGSRKDAYKAAAAAIKRQHLVKSLIVSGDTLPEARLKVRQPGNALYVSYQKLAGK